MIDPTQQAAPAVQPPEQQKRAVTIEAQGDGSFLVFEQAGPSDPLRKPVDLDEALSQAAELLGAAAPEAGQEAQQDEGDALFQQSFDKTRGVPLNRG